MVDTFRQSLLARADVCRYSAKLALDHPDQQAHELHFGAAVHAFAERLMNDLIAHGEKTLYAAAEGEDPVSAAREVASLSAAMVDEILREHPEWPVPTVDPSHSTDHLRQVCYHLAVGLDVDPDKVLGVEREFELELECGKLLTGRIDLLSEADPGTLLVDDYKSTFNVPSESAYEGLFQMKAYALLVLLGRPRDGLPPLGDGVQFVHTRQVFPRYLSDDGALRERSTVLSRQEIMDWRWDLERLASDFLARLEADGPWPATRGAHCSECAAPRLCPLPPRLRDYAGSINTREEAELAMAATEAAAADVAAMRREIRNWSKRNGALRVGDLEYAWRETMKHDPVDWDALEEDLYEAQTFGAPFSVEKHVRVKAGQSFSKRKLEPDELEEKEAAVDADERWGADAPF